MSRAVWLNDGFVDPARAAVSIDDPGMRFGEGLFESMRGESGVVAELDRHLDRLERSAAELRLPGLPPRAAIARAVVAVAARFPTGVAKVRASVTPLPTLLVEGDPVDRPELPELRAICLRGWWSPEYRLAEHKTLSYLTWRLAQRRADAADVDTALLLDRDGTLGEAATHNVFVVLDDVILTAPARGLLPGTTRARVLETVPVVERAAREDEWRAADEVFATSAVSRVSAITRIDGRDVGDGHPGPTTRAVAAFLAGR